MNLPSILFGVLVVSFTLFGKFGTASLENEDLEWSQEGDLDLDRGGEVDAYSEEAQLTARGHHHQFFGYFSHGIRTPRPVQRCVKDADDPLGERHGVCMLKSKCVELGATDSGSSCEKGLICCIFNATCDRSKETITVKRDLTYITHKPNEEDCLTDYTFPRQKNVCQLRLEFKTFNLSPPNRTGNCINDKMIIKKADNLRENLILCGQANETDHLYLHYGESNEIVINLDVAQQTGGVGDVEILVQQIRCNPEDLAPEGCSQYFTQQRGDVRSFNFDRLNGQQLNNQVYSVCVRGSEGSNSVTWTPCLGSEDFDITSITNNANAARDCPTDSVVIPGSPTTKFCTTGSLTDVTTNAKPYIMYVNFNDMETIHIPPVPPGGAGPCPPGYIEDPNDPGRCILDPNDPNPPLPDLLNRGFCLRYQRA